MFSVDIWERQKVKEKQKGKEKKLDLKITRNPFTQE